MQPPPRLPFASFSASPSNGSLQLVGPNLGTPRQSANDGSTPRSARLPANEIRELVRNGVDDARSGIVCAKG